VAGDRSATLLLRLVVMSVELERDADGVAIPQQSTDGVRVPQHPGCIMGAVNATRVLVVDDEPMVREVLARYLAKEGYAVDVAEDGEQALAACAQALPDLVLLDLMLPRIDGLEVFRRIREQAPTAVIMLTARGEETDRVVGLELGADDYVTKPFSPREVVARVRAVLRRSATVTSEPPMVVVAGDLEIDGPKRELRRGGVPVRLTRKEFDLLYLLASAPGRAFSRSELVEDVWDFAWDGDTATVTVHVRRLREKIEDDPSNPVHLMTVWGVGYRFDP
jgi:two-component system response regulator ResD